MICLYSKTNTNYNTNGDAVLNPISAQLQLTLNGAWVLTLSHPYDKEEKWKLLEEGATIQAPITCIRELSTTLQRFKIYQRQKNMHDVSVIAFPEGMEATFDTPVDNLVITNKTAAQTIDLLQPFCNNKYTLYTNLTTNGSTSWANTNVFSAIAGSSENTFLKTWGGELIFDNKTFKILSRVGDTTAANHKITYGHNLSAIDYDKDDSGVTTRIYPISQDGIRLNGTGYVDSPNHFSDYPVAHCRHMIAPYYLVDTNPGNNTATAIATQQATAAIATQAETLGRSSYATAIGGGFQPEYIKQQRDAIIAAVKAQALSGVVSASMYAAFEKAIESGLSFLASVQQPVWGWMGSEEQGWKYGDANGYATNQYIRISRKWSYFGADGNWQEPRDDSEEWDWYQGSSGTGKKYGNFKKYYAHNEFVYITEDNQMKEYWFNEQGWYESDESGDSDWDWHGSGTAEDPWWFGEEGASAGDTRKYAHDCWLFIDGTLYFFDSYGYYDGSTKFEYYQWDWVQDDERWWFGNAIDKTYAATYLTSQWAKINGDWYYFDENGYAEQTNASIARVVAVFTNGMTGLTSTISTNKSTLYTLLYDQLSAWALKQYTQGIDLPVITITVNMVDLSKTQDYQGFADLETVKLGDSVAVTDAEHGISTTNRVIGLTYDLINDYNAEVIIGSATASVASMIGGAAGQAVAGGFDSSAIETQLDTQATAIAQLRQNKQDKLNAGNLINLSGSTISADIEANPGAAGTTDLQKIRLGNTIFNLPSGGQGLQYWTETSEAISRSTNESIFDFDCAAAYLTQGIDFVMSSPLGGEREYKSTGKAVAAYGQFWYVYGRNPELFTGIVIISTDENAAKYTWNDLTFTPTTTTIDGQTVYVNQPNYFMYRTTIINDGGLINTGEHASWDDFVDYVKTNAQIIIFTQLLKSTGIGVGDKIIWGGKKYNATDTPPFYVNNSGEIYAQKYKSIGIRPGTGADAAYKKTRNHEVGNWQNGNGWTRCMVTRISASTAPIVAGHTSNAHPMIIVASLEPIDFEWGWSAWTMQPPYGVTEWGTADTYPLYAGGYSNYFGYKKETVTYNGATWYILAIDTYWWEGGTAIAGVSVFDFNYYDAEDPKAGDAGLALLEAAHATSQIPVTLELNKNDYIFKYYTEEQTIVEIDDDGNATVNEITTAAGSLTNQMAAKQNLMTAGDNITINGDIISATDTTYNDFIGATAQEAGTAGLVPAPETTEIDKFLKGDGTWATPSGGGGSANIVELTQAEYDALPSSKLSDDVLYMVYFDGGQSLDPNYNYYKYGENDEIVVRVYHEGQADQEVLWFFNNWTATALDNTIPQELQTWKPTNTNPIYSDSYATVGGAQTSWVGFYANSIRSWNITLATGYIGVVNAVVNPFPTSAGQQTNGYYSPYVYIQDSPPFTKIYYNTHEFTHKVTANPTGAATANLEKIEVDGIVYGVSGGGSGGGSDVLYSGLSVGQITLSKSIEDYSLIVAVINLDQYSTYQLTGQYSPSIVTTYSNTSIFITSPYGLNDGFYRYKFSDDTHMVWDDGSIQQQSMVVIGIK